MLDRVITIVQKEVKDAIRDPGSIFAALLYTFIGPVVVWAVIINLSSSGRVGNDTNNNTIGIYGASQSSQIVSYLKEQNFSFHDYALVKIKFPSDIDQRLANGEQADIIIKGSPGATINALRRSLATYNNMIIINRLEKYDISPDYIRPLNVVLEK